MTDSGGFSSFPGSPELVLVFPLITLVFLVMVFVLIITPFERHQ